MSASNDSLAVDEQPFVIAIPEFYVNRVTMPRERR